MRSWEMSKLRQAQRKQPLAPYRSLAAVLLVTLLAAAWRFYRLGFHSLWYDEAFTAWTVAQLPRDILWICLQDIVHPPLYYLVLAPWIQMVGNSEFALRTLSAGISVLGVPLLYQLGRRGWNRRVGLWAALLWAGAPFAVWYAQEARMYALLTVTGLAATLCLARALPGGSRRWLVANAALNLVGLYTHYFYLFNLFSQYVYLALTLRRHRRAFWRWFGFNAIAVAFYLPWLVVILRGNFYQAQIAWIDPLSLKSVWQTFWELNAGKSQQFGAAGLLVTLLLTGGVVLAATSGRKAGKGPIPGLAWSHLLVTPALVLLISFQQPLFHPRFLQIVLPAYLLLAAAGLARLSSKRLGAALLAVTVLAGIPALVTIYTASTQPDRGWQQAMGYLAAKAEPEDVVVFRGGQGFHPYWYYYDGPPLHKVDLTPEEGLADLEVKAADARRMWLVAWDPLWNCEIPPLFVPGAADRLGLADVQCFPAVVIASYTCREPGSAP
jgi:mannosyltransferase